MTKKQKLLTLELLIHGVLIVLMALPIGAVMRFGHPDPHVKLYRTFAYFDLGVLGMSGNPFPFLTAILASVGLLLILWMLVSSGKRTGKKGTACLICTLSGAAASVLALLMLSRVSAAGIAVTALMLLSACIQALIRRDEGPVLET